MRIEFLGTGGFHPSDRRHTLCLLLPESGVVFDAGSAAYRLSLAVEAGRVIPRELHIFLTHAHLDHIAGLPSLLPLTLQGQLDRIHVYGREAVLATVREHLYAPAVFPVEPDFTWHPLTGEAVELPDGGQLTYCPLKHPGGSLGYRVDWPDRSLALITDTTAHEEVAYADFIRGVDLLIHECYFPDESANWAVQTGHSHTTPVAELARECAVGRLVLIHTDPRNAARDPIGLDVARSIFPATTLPEDGAVLDLPART